MHKSFHEFLAAEGFKYRQNSTQRLHALLNNREQRIWWREVLLFWMNRKEIGELADFISMPVMQSLQTMTDDEKNNHAGIVNLCAQAATEATLEDEVLQDGDSELNKLFQALQHKLFDLMTESSIAIGIRAECGQLLGRLGDYRPGVGIVRNDTTAQPLFFEINNHQINLPDIIWEKILAGSFQMGSTNNDDEAYQDEKPAHTLFVNEFYMSAFPVTNAQYQCFIDAGGYDDERYWRTSAAALAWRQGEAADLSLIQDFSDELKKDYENWLLQDTQCDLPRFWEERLWNNPNHPVVGVSWYEVLAYCEWLNDCLQQSAVSENIELAAKFDYRVKRNGNMRQEARRG